ncbi:T9SS type A sorting domain-containing protein [Pontibacter sp. BT213]|uniref:T9SS type A sorting domain-containing protein n=1 Tax=Pontibacter fetidus TaxID=2700082 RepID=A0A6B2HA64_9BACT|nr:T9SS type A sorting domain-containing protein [Pontibacter fetidus]
MASSNNPYYITNSNSINVIPANGVGGQVKVRGYNQECSAFSYPKKDYFSNYSTLTINREPTLGAITASATTVNCANTTPVTISVPALPGEAYYTWSLPPGWVISGPGNGNTITVIPSGTNGGQVSVSATLTCTSPTKTVNATSITIAYSSTLAKPAFNNNNAPYDIGASTPYSIQPVPGATSYTWEASSNILINGGLSPVTTSDANVTLAQRPGYSGAGWVKVTATNPQCGASSVEKEVWVGIPEIIGFRYTCMCTNGFNYPACPYEQGAFEPIYNGYKGQVQEYAWTATNVDSHLGLTGPNLFIVAASQPRTVMVIGLKVRTAIDWTSYWDEEYEVRNCDAGEEPYIVAPNPVTEDDFTIETQTTGTYTYTLFDQQGNKKLSGSSKEKTKISVRNLPAGLYFMHIAQNGRTSKKQLLIK